MYKTILVPLDGSELAEAVLPHVESLATLCGSRVILLQVIELSHQVGRMDKAVDGLPHVTAGEMEQQIHEAQRYLDGTAEWIRAKGIDAHARLEYGPVVATIVLMAAQEDAGLIAMASHGRGGLSDVYYGSVAAGVLQRIDRPLLFVRAQS